MANANESRSSGRQQGPQQQGGEGIQRRGQQSAWQGSAEQPGSAVAQARTGTSLAAPYFGAWGGGPLSMMRRMSEDMDRLFESFAFGRGLFPSEPGHGMFAGGGGAEHSPGLWRPHIAVYERNDKLHVDADLPGVRKEDVHVAVTGDAVTIQGHRKQEEARSEDGFYHSERRYGSFYRRIPLPEGTDAENAAANFRDGVLHIEIPAPSQRARGRTLHISDGDTNANPRETGGGAQPGSSGSQQQR